MHNKIIKITLLLSIFTTILNTGFCIDDFGGSKLENNAINKNPSIIEFIKDTLNKIKTTKYERGREICDNDGRFITDGAGFANFILINLCNNAYEMLEMKESSLQTNKSTPSAITYYNAFMDSVLTDSYSYKHWQKITNIMNAMPGDFIAWTEDTHYEITTSHHVLIILSAPELLEDGTVSIEVADASKYPHSNDTRKAFDGGGIGTGTMRFKINVDGEPVAFHWSLKKSKPKFRKIAIGRLK